MADFGRMVDVIFHGKVVARLRMTKTRDKSAASRFLKKALKRHGKAERIVTDGLRSYPAAMRDLGNLDRRESTLQQSG